MLHNTLHFRSGSTAQGGGGVTLLRRVASKPRDSVPDNFNQNSVTGRRAAVGGGYSARNVALEVDRG